MQSDDVGWSQEEDSKMQVASARRHSAHEHSIRPALFASTSTRYYVVTCSSSFLLSNTYESDGRPRLGTTSDARLLEDVKMRRHWNHASLASSVLAYRWPPVVDQRDQTALQSDRRSTSSSRTKKWAEGGFFGFKCAHRCTSREQSLRPWKGARASPVPCRRRCCSGRCWAARAGRWSQRRRGRLA